jgi:GNAT superfamily N-acetyltransferase
VADAPALAAIQRDNWLALLGADLPGWPQTLSLEEMAATWANGIALGQADGPYEVFVALGEAGQLVGFAAAGPLVDPDLTPGGAELVALWVAPAHQRAGHGSRLLAAVADAARARAAPRLAHWVTRQDIYRQRFLRAAGFGPDGAERSWQAPTGELIDEQRWSALL